MPIDWEDRYRDASVADADPAAVLAENDHLLPAGGRALDVACGLGGNAVYLARAGFDVVAWDSSETAIAKLAAFAQDRGLSLTAEVRDVVAAPPEAAGYDVIAVSRFLERELAPALITALRPGGVLLYQTFNRTRLSDRGPGSRRFRLADNELLDLFDPLRIRVYREEDRIGDLSRGWRDEAQLVAHKPRGGES
ncbi:class I SAM-dependent methyltransferase [Thiohalorhabdus sp.]|uniref:class I SAM-dependent methyltransferase n=1 Tax=Thiohalorhabdus sp. TaxID=3094134 RepID=UPI002FC33283